MCRESCRHRTWRQLPLDSFSDRKFLELFSFWDQTFFWQNHLLVWRCVQGITWTPAKIAELWFTGCCCSERNFQLPVFVPVGKRQTLLSSFFFISCFPPPPLLLHCGNVYCVLEYFMAFNSHHASTVSHCCSPTSCIKKELSERVFPQQLDLYLLCRVQEIWMRLRVWPSRQPALTKSGKRSEIHHEVQRIPAVLTGFSSKTCFLLKKARRHLTQSAGCCVAEGSLWAGKSASHEWENNKDCSSSAQDWCGISQIFRRATLKFHSHRAHEPAIKAYTCRKFKKGPFFLSIKWEEKFSIMSSPVSNRSAAGSLSRFFSEN